MAQLNTNRTFIDLGFEGVWGNEAVAWAAGTQLDINGAGPHVMLGLVQPRQPAYFQIDVTDGDASISAYQIDVVGTDEQGNAATEQFTFAADGIGVTTGTQKFLTLTSCTVTSNTGAGAGDLLDANWSPMRLLVPVLGYDVNLDDPVREQPHIQGDQDTFYAVQDRRNLAGSMRTGVWPHLSRKLLDLATLRTSGETDSFCARDDLPGIEARVHAGLKVDALTIEGSVESDITFNFDLRGRHEETESNLTYPGTYTIPTTPSLTFKNTRYVISLNAGSDDAFANRITPVGLSSFTLSFRNNLKEGPPVEDRIDTEKDGIPEYLTAGRKNMEVRYTATFDRQAFSTMKRQRLYTQFKMVGAHPNYSTYGTVAGAGASAGSAVVVTLGAAASGFINVGDYVLFDNAGEANLPCVGDVTAVTDGTPSITIGTLDEDVAVGDHVFAAAVEFRTAPIAVSAVPIQKNHDDTVLVEVSGQIFSGGATPLSYKVRDVALPS